MPKEGIQEMLRDGIRFSKKTWHWKEKKFFVTDKKFMTNYIYSTGMAGKAGALGNNLI